MKEKTLLIILIKHFFGFTGRLPHSTCLCKQSSRKKNKEKFSQKMFTKPPTHTHKNIQPLFFTVSQIVTLHFTVVNIRMTSFLFLLAKVCKSIFLSFLLFGYIPSFMMKPWIFSGLIYIFFFSQNVYIIISGCALYQVCDDTILSCVCVALFDTRRKQLHSKSGRRMQRERKIQKKGLVFFLLDLYVYHDVLSNKKTHREYSTILADHIMNTFMC